MCEPSHNLKLCTCGDLVFDGELKAKSWKLILDKRKQIMMGEVTPIYYRGQDSIQEIIYHQLVVNDPFDFDYQPKYGDKLIIKWSDDLELRYIYRMSNWTIDYTVDKY